MANYTSLVLMAAGSLSLCRCDSRYEKTVEDIVEYRERSKATVLDYLVKMGAVDRTKIQEMMIDFEGDWAIAIDKDRVFYILKQQGQSWTLVQAGKDMPPPAGFSPTLMKKYYTEEHFKRAH